VDYYSQGNSELATETRLIIKKLEAVSRMTSTNHAHARISHEEHLHFIWLLSFLATQIDASRDSNGDCSGGASGPGEIVRGTKDATLFELGRSALRNI
jgi:hypothetical protein